MFDYISENIKTVLQKINDARAESGWDQEEVKLIAVTKNVSVEKIKKAAECGLNFFGENRVGEALEKIEQADFKAEWHLIGHLQTNKVNKASLFSMIQSVDSLRLSEKLNARLARENKIMPVLIEINTSGEETKYGFEFNLKKNIDDVIRIAEFSNLKVRGLMTIGKFTSNENEVRDSFKKLKELFDALAEKENDKLKMEWLSMGMSSDYEIAIDEGSNMVRIGAAIFGERNR